MLTRRAVRGRQVVEWNTCLAIVTQENALAPIPVEQRLNCFDGLANAAGMTISSVSTQTEKTLERCSSNPNSQGRLIALTSFGEIVVVGVRAILVDQRIARTAFQAPVCVGDPLIDSEGIEKKRRKNPLVPCARVWSCREFV